MRPLLAPILRFLDSVEERFDASETARSESARRFRRVVGMGVMLAAGWSAGGARSPAARVSPFVVLMLFIGFAIYKNQFGRFLRDWSPVALMFLIYGIALELVEVRQLPIWYWPQIRCRRVIGLGNVPSVALQEWLGAGHNQPLAVLSALAYMSHFLVPAAVRVLRVVLAPRRRLQRATCTPDRGQPLAACSCVLTARRAAVAGRRAGLIPPVVDVIKDGPADHRLRHAGAAQGTPTRLPDRGGRARRSTPRCRHLGVLVARRYRLPRWVQTVLIAHLCVIWFIIVYTGEHYVIDIAVGVVFALVAWWIVQTRGRQDRRPGAPVEVPAGGRPARPPARPRQARLRGNRPSPSGGVDTLTACPRRPT